MCLPRQRERAAQWHLLAGVRGAGRTRCSRLACAAGLSGPLQVTSAQGTGMSLGQGLFQEGKCSPGKSSEQTWPGRRLGGLLLLGVHSA